MPERTATGDVPPILVDLGKVKGKVVRQFREGRGEIAEDVHRILEETRKVHGTTKDLVPIVLIYEKKPKRRKAGGGIFPFM